MKPLSGRKGAWMGKWVKVAKKNELPSGSGKVVSADGKELALFNCDGTFYVLDNTCQHQGGPLGDGALDGKTVMCPWHGWEYDVTTGSCLTNPNVQQSSFKVKAEDDDIFIEV